MGNLWSRFFGPWPSSNVDIASPPSRTQSDFIPRFGQGSKVRHRSQSLPENSLEEAAMKIHYKARCEVYARSEVRRVPVPDDKVSWEVPWVDYQPVDYTAESILKMPPYADVDFRDDNCTVKPTWNGLDGKINRRSHSGEYVLDGKVPRNICGRTGMRGRGCLGRWGPNHAADPIVTRWKKDENNRHVTKDGKLVLEFIAVQRRDNGEWALPGGMVDAGEVVTMTLKREFGEEALNSLEASKEEKKKIEACINEVFSHGKEVYRGYVDDPRNTDNAWMETVALNFHDEEGNGVAKIKLNAGDDAIGVQWMELSHDLALYASHIHFLETTAKERGAHW